MSLFYAKYLPFRDTQVINFRAAWRAVEAPIAGTDGLLSGKRFSAKVDQDRQSSAVAGVVFAADFPMRQAGTI